MLKKKSLEDRLRTAELNLLESSQSLLSSSATSPAYGPERAIDKYQQYYQAYTQKWFVVFCFEYVSVLSCVMCISVEQA